MSEVSESQNPLQDALLAQVRELTQRRGSRKELAAHLGIPATRLSEYLGDPPTHRPSGEMTLLLQSWVTREKESYGKS